MNRFAKCAFGAAVVVTSAAFAAPVDVDGIIGLEWTGASIKSVGFNPAAAEGNFGAPTNENKYVAYDILTRNDGNYAYVALVSRADLGGATSSAHQYTNLYFGGHTSVGFEVLSGNAFRPGLPGSYPFASLDGTANEIFHSENFGSQYVIEVAVPLSFFTSDPLAMGFNTLSGAPGDSFLRLNLSQSYGYSVAGGQAFYGDDRLGSFGNIPAPSAAGLLALAGLAASRRRR